MSASLSIAIRNLADAPVAASMSAGVRSALLVLLALLVVIFGCLIAFAFVLRRQPAEEPAKEAETPEPSPRPARDPMACPVCHREFVEGLRFCPHDATALIPAPKMLERAAEQTRAVSVCPTCRRAFEGKVSFCPHDGSDLVLMAARVRGADEDSDADQEDIASSKICPECSGRYGFTASFCGKDGVELVVLN